MNKVTIEYEESEFLGSMFTDAIVACIQRKMEYMAKLNREKDTLSESEVLMHVAMIDFYNEKIDAYTKMRESMTW
jgi:hypothetical protein